MFDLCSLPDRFRDIDSNTIQLPNRSAAISVWSASEQNDLTKEYTPEVQLFKKSISYFKVYATSYRNNQIQGGQPLTKTLAKS